MTSMIAAETAQSAREALWGCIVELAEAAHQQAVDGQANPSAEARDKLSAGVHGVRILLDAITLLDAAGPADG